MICPDCWRPEAPSRGRMLAERCHLCILSAGTTQLRRVAKSRTTHAPRARARQEHNAHNPIQDLDMRAHTRERHSLTGTLPL